MSDKHPQDAKTPVAAVYRWWMAWEKKDLGLLEAMALEDSVEFTGSSASAGPLSWKLPGGPSSGPRSSAGKSSTLSFARKAMWPWSYIGGRSKRHSTDGQYPCKA